MRIRSHGIYKSLPEPALNPAGSEIPPFRQQGMGIDLKQHIVALLQLRGGFARVQAGIALDVRHDHPIPPPLQHIQRLLHLPEGDVRREFHQHLLRPRQPRQTVIHRILSHRRGVQQLRAGIQRQRISPCPAVSPGFLQAQAKDIGIEGLDSGRRMRRRHQRRDAVRVSCVQHCFHVFPGSGAVIHPIDKVRVNISKPGDVILSVIFHL